MCVCVCVCVCACVRVCVCVCVCVRVSVCVRSWRKNGFAGNRMHTIRRAGTASSLSRLQAQAFFSSHQQFLENKEPVQQHHRLCIQHLVDTGRVKAQAASPATLALLLATPGRPANLMKPFMCFFFNVQMLLHSQQRQQDGSRRIGPVSSDGCADFCVRHQCTWH